MNINVDQNDNADDAQQQQLEEQEHEPSELDDTIGNIHVLMMHRALTQFSLSPIVAQEFIIP